MGFFNIEKKNSNRNSNHMNASGNYLNQQNNYMNGQGAFPSQLYNQDDNYRNSSNNNLTNFNNGNNVYRPSGMNGNMNNGMNPNMQQMNGMQQVNNMQQMNNMQSMNQIDNSGMQAFPTAPKRSYVVSSNNGNNQAPSKNMGQANMPQQAPEPKPKNDTMNFGEIFDEPKPSNELNPLNNATNPTPVNPVAPKEVVDVVARDSKPTLFEAISAILGIVLHPCDTVIKNTKKYRYNGKALAMFLYFNLIAVVLCFASRILFGGFTRTYNSITSSFTNEFNISNIFTLGNYLWPIIGCLCVTAAFTLLVSLVYYICSFINSKGVTFGTYLMIAEQSIFPFFAGVFFIFPLTKLIASTLAFAMVGLMFLYSFLIFISSISELLVFKSNDNKVFYNLFNMLIVSLILFLSVSTFLRVNSYDLSYLISLIS